MAENFFAKFEQPQPDGNYFAKFEAGAPSPGMADRVRAGAAGVNRGFYADLLGLPVDTVANALDLGKAGIGYAASKITGKAPPDWTTPYDRSGVPGTSEWIAAQARKGSNAVGIESPLDNPNPQDATSRIAFSGGRMGGASIVPNPRAAVGGVQTLGNIIRGGVAGVAGGAVGEVAPDYAGVASMLPQAGANAFKGGAKMAVRGGEQGRQDMAQRIQDLKNGGISNPSMGLASGNPLIMGVENLLSKVPGSVGAYQDANAANFAGMRAKLGGARDMASTQYGPATAGSAIQADLTSTAPGVRSLPNRISGGYQTLLDQVMQRVGPDTPIPVNNTLGMAGTLSTPNPAAPNVSALSVQPRIARINQAFQADNGGTLPTNILGMQIPGQPARGIPFDVVKNQRTSIGEELNSPNVIGTPVEGQYKRLYGAMSDDLGQGAMLSDAANAGPQMPGMGASAAWNRANNLYSAGMDRMDQVRGIAGKQSPEQAYQAYLQAANGNVSTLQAVKKSINPETRGTVAATMLDDMGAATPGHQDNTGTLFSPDSFLTRYNKMGPGRDELLSGFPNAGTVRGAVDDVAGAASMLKDGAKIWANPSGTGGNVAASASLGGIAGNLISNPMSALGAVGGLVGANQLNKRFLLNGDKVNMAASNQVMDPMALQAMLQRMGVQGLLSDQ